MDLALYETGNGGDIQFKGRDFVAFYGWENMVYLALFGGNVGFPTTGRKLDNEQDFSYWGNNLLWPNDQSKQFNSLTEKRLQDVALNSAGRVLIEQDVISDLSFMSSFAEVSVSVSIISDDKVKIEILVKQPDNLEDKAFVFIWDSTKMELIDNVNNYVDKPPAGDFDVNDFNNDFL